MNALPLIEKIHLLESSLGDRFTYPILEPFKFNSSNIYEIQKAGSLISQHLGLSALTFIVTIKQQKQNVGGNVHLDNTKDVFIEIDEKFKDDCDFILAILAHEICRKYLQINNLKLFPDFENEMLTDATTIYTGLGKLSLNGCEKIFVTTSKSYNTTTTTTTTQKIGYMDRQQFSFVYRLVCEMRRIPQKEILSGLSVTAANEVKSITSNNGNSFSESYFRNDFLSNEIDNSLKNEIGEAQKAFARFSRNIRIINEIVMHYSAKINSDFHTSFNLKYEKINSIAAQSQQSESHNYIKNLLAYEEFQVFKESVIEKETEMKKVGTVLQGCIEFLSDLNPKEFSFRDSSFLFQFSCPICNAKMKISQSKIARVSCPKCKYNFIVETGIENFESVKAKKNITTEHANSGIISKMKSVFRKF
jgi:hypothetical protein